MTFPIPMLADGDPFSVFLWSGILIGTLVVLYVGVTMIRKWMKSSDADGDSGFTLSDLRKLHREGKISSEEFERAKALLIGSLKKSIQNTSPEGPRTSSDENDTPENRN